MTVNNYQKRIIFQCPTCNQKKPLDIPEIINSSGTLTTISISAGMICPHTFQAFLDNNLKIRGYQKVDYELNIDENSSKNTFGGYSPQILLDTFVHSDFNILGASIINLNGTPLVTSLSKVKYKKLLFRSSTTLYNISEKVASELFNGFSRCIILKLEKNLLILSKVKNQFLLVISRGDPNLQMIMIEIEDLIEQLSEIIE